MFLEKCPFGKPPITTHPFEYEARSAPIDSRRLKVPVVEKPKTISGLTNTFSRSPKLVLGRSSNNNCPSSETIFLSLKRFNIRPSNRK